MLGLRGRDSWCGGGGVVRATGERVSLVQAAADDAAGGERLLRAAAAEGESLNVLNLPASDVLGDAFRALGGRLALRQLELRLQL